MKQFKKVILAMMCVAVVFGTTACGSRNNMNNDAANDTPAGQEDRNGTTTDYNYSNNNGTDYENQGGVIDDLGNAVGNGIEDVGRGVKDITDDMTGTNNNRRDMTNDATNGTTNRSTSY